MNKTSLGLASSLALAIAAAPAAYAETVKIGVPSWTGAQAIAGRRADAARSDPPSAVVDEH